MCHCQNAVSGVWPSIPSWESLQWVSKSLLDWWPSLSPTWASFPSFDNDRLLCILSSCLILSCPNSQLSIYRILQASCHFRAVGPLRLHKAHQSTSMLRLSHRPRYMSWSLRLLHSQSLSFRWRWRVSHCSLQGARLHRSVRTVTENRTVKSII